MKHIIIGMALMAALLSAAAAEAFTTTGFQNPYGVVVDTKTNFIYISNVNGDLNGSDDNGFISRLKGDGTVDSLRFIDGSASDIALNAPKGMAIVGSTLYVADLDKIRAFDLASGKRLFEVNFGDLPVQHFYDISPGPDDALYAADGPGNIIYRIDVPKMHEVTTFATGDVLGQPHSVCWYPARQVFMVAGWSLGQVIALDRAGKQQVTPGIFLRTLEGMRTDESGNLYVSSQALSSIFKIAPNLALSAFALGQSSPAGIAFHSVGNQIIAASFDSGTVQSFPIQPGQ